ncbi:CAP domain-containing protein [Streptomyces sp. NPDC051636]|uniref:CAP domain-containing protein n=1 Tax=Streptomyces sp. NPDC051636 TaxID=3365663 RepID=UPI003791CBFE
MLGQNWLEEEGWDPQWDPTAGGSLRFRKPGARSAEVSRARTEDSTTKSAQSLQRLLEDAVAALVNRERDQRGLVCLVTDERLRDAARSHSEDMARRQFFDHFTPEGLSPADRMLAYGFPLPAAENIAAGQPHPLIVMAGWMNSPGHRVNILNEDVRVIGVGVYLAQDGPVWTQNFGYA